MHAPSPWLLDSWVDFKKKIQAKTTGIQTDSPIRHEDMMRGHGTKAKKMN